LPFTDIEEINAWMKSRVVAKAKGALQASLKP